MFIAILFDEDIRHVSISVWKRLRTLIKQSFTCNKIVTCIIKKIVGRLTAGHNFNDFFFLHDSPYTCCKFTRHNNFWFLDSQ